MAIEAGRYVLLVEDNPDDELLTLRAFKKNSINVEIRVVRDGQDAVDFFFSEDMEGGMLKDQLGLPAFVLLDLQLPKIDGIEVLRRIRKNSASKSLPVIVLTTSDEQRDVLKSYGLGANSYVRKPVNFKKFVETVGQLGIYWLTTNVPAENAS
ncbi:MAG: response regulator [Myxococcota bacterium]